MMDNRRTQSQNADFRDKGDNKYRENRTQIGRQFFKQYMKNAMKYRNKDLKFQIKQDKTICNKNVFNLELMNKVRTIESDKNSFNDNFEQTAYFGGIMKNESASNNPINHFDLPLTIKKAKSGEDCQQMKYSRQIKLDKLPFQSERKDHSNNHNKITANDKIISKDQVSRHLVYSQQKQLLKLYKDKKLATDNRTTDNSFKIKTYSQKRRMPETHFLSQIKQ